MKRRVWIYLISGLIVLIFSGSFIHKAGLDSASLRNITYRLQTFYNWYPQQKVYLHTDKSVYHYDERVWVSAYLLDATTHEPDPTENNLYVEIVNPSGYVSHTKVVRMEEGFGQCDFTFRDTVPEGYYKIRAYTNWMRNLGSDFYFSREIYIENPEFLIHATRDDVSAMKRSKRSIARKESSYDVSFLPEGGHLLSNVPNKIAFKAINDMGEGIDIEGELTDRSRNTILQFSSSHQGMGAFTFTPEEGNSYTAHVRAEGLKDMSFRLPKLTNKGINISASHQEDQLKVKIISNLRPENYPPNTTYFFLAHVRGNPVYTTEVNIMNHETLDFNIPKNQLSTGIMHLTLFNHIPAPVSERLVFIHNHEVLNIDIQPNQLNFARREKVHLEFNITDPNNRPVRSRLSLSVAEEEAAGNPEGIIASLLLSSDIKGKIENPDYYFNGFSHQKQQELDYLMLTQGWRRFTWSEVFTEQKLSPKYQKANGLEVSGRITRNFFNLPLRDIRVTLTIKDQFNDVFMTRSDQGGNFRFSNLNYTDTVSVRVEAERSGGRRNLVILINEMKQPRLEEMNYRTHQPLRKPGEKGRWGQPEEPEEEDPLHEANTRMDRIHPEPRNVIIIDENLQHYQNVLQILQGRVPGVDVTGNRVTIRGTSSLFGSSDPLYLVDDIPTDPDHALSISPLDVERIEILKGPDAAIYGVRGGNGVIAVYTRRGKFIIRGQVDFKMLGYAAPREFYSPKYEPEKFDPFEDDRTTLFWKPEIKTGTDGKASVSFFTSDIPGNYTITMEGVGMDGLPGTSTQIISVR